MKHGSIAATFVALVSFTACEPSTSPTASPDVQPAGRLTVTAHQQTDSVAWDENGIMEFMGEDGDYYKLQREGPAENPSSVTIWENNILVGTIDFFDKHGSVPERYRWEDPIIDWADTDEMGTLLATSVGMPPTGGGGGCSPGEPGCV